MFDWLLPYIDYLFLGGAAILDLAFLPTLLRSANKPDRWTSMIFTIVLGSMTFGFLALGLNLSAIAQTVGALMWGITIFQKQGQRTFCRHRPEDLTLVIWGHEASKQYDCTCGVTLCPGHLDYAKWIVKYGRENLPGRHDDRL